MAFSVVERLLADAAEVFAAEADRLGAGQQAAMLALETAFAVRSDPELEAD